jgi:GAF domain-containing protein
MKMIDHPEVKEQKSAIFVPLEAWGRAMGVLCLDNVTTYNAFRESDLDLLSIFGAQASIAIQNANLNTTLYKLGLKINHGDLKPKEIFNEVVRSITQVSGAKGANMFLLRDTDDPGLSVSQEPILSASYGLAVGYEYIVKPRPKGLTFRVLETRKPQWVSNPNEKPGINRLALKHDVRACLCLPMMIQDSIIGILFVHYKKPHKFTENEIEMLSLFVNQAALAIDNARQREELTMTKAVAWMGLVNTNLAHRITQEAGAIRNTVFGLRQKLIDDPEGMEWLDDIDKYAQTVREIPGRALIPFHDQAIPVDLNANLSHEIAQWCRSEDALVPDFGGLTNNDTTIMVDPKWLGIVLEMLTVNAIRAMKGTPNKKLSIHSNIRGRRVVVEMTNTGKMIPKKVCNLLFKEPIPRAEGAEGSGVGLLIARTIIRRYGGDIELLRTGPKETTFSFWLPLHRIPK